MRIVRVSLVVFLFFMVAGQSFAQPQQPTAILNVNVTVDAVDINPGDGSCDAQPTAGNQCSLRAAIQEANASAGSDLITVPGGTYSLAINGKNEDLGATGDFDITDDVTIIGALDGTTIIQGEPNWDDRIVEVHEGTIVSFLRLMMTKGTAQAQGNMLAQGGGIQNMGELTIIKSAITDNWAAEGGGIYSTGVLTVSNSTINFNQASTPEYGYGGGIYTAYSGKLTLMNSVVYYNEARSVGGGLYLCGSTATIVNTTIGANVSEYGGGLHNACKTNTTTLNNVTVAYNVADGDHDGSGYGGGLSLASGKITIANTIVAKNRHGVNTPDDCNGTITSQGFNLIQSLTACTLTGMGIGNILGMQPQLGPLQANGGSTYNYPLLPGSPALNAGNPGAPNSDSGACAATDQRGVSRPLNGRCDIGAVEAERSLVFIPLVQR